MTNIMAQAHQIRLTKLQGIPYHQAMQQALKLVWRSKMMENLLTAMDNMTSEELQAIIAKAQTLLTPPAVIAEVKPMRVFVSYGSYNERRYSKPWIGKITSWPIGGKPEIKWGSFIGDDHGGEVEIMALPGEIVRWGQKDNRGNGTEACWGVVTIEGRIEEIDAAKARKLWESR